MGCPMSKKFFRVLAVLFLACCSIAYAQTEPPVPIEQHEQSIDNSFDTMQGPPTYKGAFVKMMVTLLGLIVLIVISVWMLRRISHGRMKQMNYGREIKILERRPLSAKSVLYLVEIGGKKVVVAESQVEIRAITTADHITAED